MVSFLRPWLFLFIIILGEMLLVEIKITIKTPQNTKRNMTIHMCFETKTVKYKILRVLNENSFREGFYHTFVHLLLRIISYTLNVLNVLLEYEFHLRFSVKKGFI